MNADELLKKNADRAFELLEQKAPHQLAVELVAAHDRTTMAERALDHAGFTYTEGAQEWRPPAGPSASPLLDRIDLLTFLLRELRDGVEGEWCFPDNLDERIDAALADQVKPFILAKGKMPDLSPDELREIQRTGPIVVHNKPADMQEGWQPIGSAPKDGTKILLFFPLADNKKGVTEKGHWDDDRFSSRPRPYWTNSSARTWGANNLRKEPPTHWMHLPANPKTEGGE